MSKKILAVLLVVLLILVAAGVLFLNKESPAPATTPVPETSETTAPETDVVDMQYDDSPEETRIIMATPDDKMLNELLSDKVIRDDKIVDKSQAGTPQDISHTVRSNH